jgi:hypothetical protein
MRKRTRTRAHRSHRAQHICDRSRHRLTRPHIFGPASTCGQPHPIVEQYDARVRKHAPWQWTNASGST